MRTAADPLWPIIRDVAAVNPFSIRGVPVRATNPAGTFARTGTILGIDGRGLVLVGFAVASGWFPWDRVEVMPAG